VKTHKQLPTLPCFKRGTEILQLF